MTKKSNDIVFTAALRTAIGRYNGMWKKYQAYDLGKGSDMNEMIAKINHLPEDKFYDELYKVFLNPKVQSPMGIRQLRLRLGKGTEGAEGMKMLLRRRIKDAQDLAIRPAELQERVISKKMFGRGKSVGEELNIFDTNKFIEELDNRFERV